MQKQKISGSHAEECAQIVVDHPTPPSSKVTHIKRGPLNGDGVLKAFSDARVEEVSHMCVKDFPCAVLFVHQLSYLRDMWNH